MEIVELTSFEERDLRDLDMLMHELSPSSECTEEKLQRLAASPDSHLYVARDEGHIIASACLCVGHTTEFTLGFVEAVVVSRLNQGRRLGRSLMEHLIAEARKMGVESLHLTSNPRREAANALYRKLGFEGYDTNVYHMKLSGNR